MATAREVITGTLRKLRVYAAGETPTAEDMDDCLVSLNEMLASWRNDGIDLSHVTLALSDTLDVPDDHLVTVKLSLAEHIGGEYGAELSATDAAVAERGRMALRAAYFTIAKLDTDSPLGTGKHSTSW